MSKSKYSELIDLIASSERMFDTIAKINIRNCLVYISSNQPGATSNAGYNIEAHIDLDLPTTKLLAHVIKAMSGELISKMKAVREQEIRILAREVKDEAEAILKLVKTHSRGDIKL